jgi:hypothetical protein
LQHLTSTGHTRGRQSCRLLYVGNCTLSTASNITIMLPVLRQFHSLLQSKFSSQCDLVFPPSTFSICLFSEGYPVAANDLLLVFPCLISFLQQSISEGISYERCDQSSQTSFTLHHVGYSLPPGPLYYFFICPKYKILNCISYLCSHSNYENYENCTDI